MGGGGGGGGGGGMLAASLFASLAGFLFGYDLGLIGGALGELREAFGASDAALGAVVAGAKVGSVFGAFLGGGVMWARGRRSAMGAAAAFFITGPLIMAAAGNIAVLFLGRVVVGLGVGSSAVAVPAYLGEISPPARRGQIVELFEAMLCVGMLASMLVDVLLEGQPNSWRWMVGLPVIPACLFALAPCVLVESPRWLVTVGDMDGALAALHRIRAAPGVVKDGRSASEVEAELLDVWDGVEKSKAAMGEVIEDFYNKHQPLGRRSALSFDESGQLDIHGPSAESASSEGVVEDAKGGETQTTAKRKVPPLVLARIWVKEIFSGQDSRAIRVALLLAVVNQASASTSIVNYGPTVLTQMGVSSRDSKYLSSGISACKLLGVIISMLVVDGLVGRRPLLIWGSVGMCLGMAMMTISENQDSVGGVVFSQYFYMLAYSSSWAGVFWVLLSELFSMRTKAIAQSLATAVMFAGGALADLFFLSLHSALGAFSYLIFGGIALLGGAYVFFVVPETKGRPLLEIQKLMQLGGLVPLRYWRGYKRSASEMTGTGSSEEARLRATELS